MDPQAWEEVGLYHPDSPGADERRAVLEHLTERGATLEQMVEAHRLGILPAIAGDLALREGPAVVSVAEMAARPGVPVERVQRVLLAMGLPVAADGELPGDLGALVSAFEQAADLMRRERHPRLFPGLGGGGHQHRRGGRGPLLRRAGTGYWTRGIGRVGSCPGGGDGDTCLLHGP